MVLDDEKSQEKEKEKPKYAARWSSFQLTGGSLIRMFLFLSALLSFFFPLRIPFLPSSQKAIALSLFLCAHSIRPPAAGSCKRPRSDEDRQQSSYVDYLIYGIQAYIVYRGKGCWNARQATGENRVLLDGTRDDDDDNDVYAAALQKEKQPCV